MIRYPVFFWENFIFWRLAFHTTITGKKWNTGPGSCASCTCQLTITRSSLSHGFVAEFIWCMTLYGMVSCIIFTFTIVHDWRFFLMFRMHLYQMVLFRWHSVCLNMSHIMTVLTIAMVPHHIHNNILWCFIVLLITWHEGIDWETGTVC